MKLSSARVLGFGGLIGAGLIGVGGFCDVPILVGLSGAVMIVANLYAMVKA